MTILLSCDKTYRDIAEQQFADAGITLDTRKVIMVSNRAGDAHDWSLDHENHFESSLRKAQDEYRPRDLVFIDWEPSNFHMKNGFDQSILDRMSHLYERVADKFGRLSTGIYGVPFNNAWRPFTNQNAIYGARAIFRDTQVGWAGVNAYLAYNTGSGEQGSYTLAPGLVGDRLHATHGMIRSISKDLPIYDFFQLLLRGDGRTEYQELTDETVAEWFTAKACSWTSGTIVWYDPSAREDDGTIHPTKNLYKLGDALKRYGPIINKVIEDNTPGRE